MPITFQADADFNQVIVSAVVRRHREIDFRTATAAGLARLNDPEVLALAARDGRVLVTHDHRTMPRYFGAATKQMAGRRRKTWTLSSGALY